MTSAVDICNLALSHLGDSATVASIDPPDGSAQADHCARFYNISLSALLEAYPWAFSTTRATLAQINNPSTTWAYAYALPAGVINIIAILTPSAGSDHLQAGVASPQDFDVETLLNGDDVLLTNTENAVLRYTRHVEDTSRFSPLFVETLGWLLASKLAGPILKGASGMEAAKACIAQYQFWKTKAMNSDANQRRITGQTQHVSGWISAR